MNSQQRWKEIEGLHINFPLIGFFNLIFMWGKFTLSHPQKNFYVLGNFQIIDFMHIIFQALGYLASGIFDKGYYSFPLVMKMGTHICPIFIFT
jgi:hypothetical protein